VRMSAPMRLTFQSASGWVAAAQGYAMDRNHRDRRSVSAGLIAGAVMMSLLLAVRAVMATTIFPPSVERAFATSDVVAMVRIDAATELFVSSRRCGTRYAATVVEAFKSSAGRLDQITFGRMDALKPGRTYVLFLDNIADPVVMYEVLTSENEVSPEGRLLRELPRQEGLDHVRCHGLTPGLDADALFVWEVWESQILFDHVFLPQDWPPSIPVSPGLKRKSASRDEILAYLRSLR
jgi:hypothetical protein